jgi:hypothetical protein
LAMLEKNEEIGEKPSCFGMLLNGTIIMEICCKYVKCLSPIDYWVTK